MGDNRRIVRSYVLRTTRFSEAQKRAYRDHGPRFVVPYQSTPLDWEKWFPGRKRHIVEIGFGMGDATRRMAKSDPDSAYLGIEVHRPGVGKLLWWIDKEGLENVKIVEHDAVEVIETMIPPGTVDGIHVFFPDPWPKKRHHKRRLLASPFLRSATRCLKAGGYVHIATDWEPYAEEIVSALTSIGTYSFPRGKWAPRPSWRPETKFEGKGIRADRRIRDIVALKTEGDNP